MKLWFLAGACAALITLGACSEDDDAGAGGKGGTAGSAGKGSGGKGGSGGSAGKGGSGGGSGSGGSTATGGAGGSGGSSASGGSGGASGTAGTAGGSSGAGGAGGGGGSSGAAGSGGSAGGDASAGSGGAAGAGDAGGDACPRPLTCQDLDAATSSYSPTSYVLVLGLVSGAPAPSGGSITIPIGDCNSPTNLFAGLEIQATRLRADFTESGAPTDIAPCGPAVLTLSDACTVDYTVHVDVSFANNTDGGVFQLSCPANDGG
jgi:hypothetical protein